MNQHKYACPHCGQNIEYSEAYSGLQVPCPKCQQSIVFPGLAATSKLRSSLRLARPMAPLQPKFQFNVASILLFAREFKHWKIVGMCLVPFVLVAGALVASSVANRHETAPVAVAPAQEAVDPHALDQLTDLTRADQLVQERLAAVSAAAAACQTADHNQQQTRNQRPRAGAPSFQDASLQRAQSALASAKKSFDTAFAQYQKLGGTVDYRLQLP